MNLLMQDTAHQFKSQIARPAKRYVHKNALKHHNLAKIGVAEQNRRHMQNRLANRKMQGVDPRRKAKSTRMLGKVLPRRTLLFPSLSAPK